MSLSQPSGSSPGPLRLQFRGQRRLGVAVALERLAPRRPRLAAPGLQAGGQVFPDAVRHEKLGVHRPAVGLLDQLDLVSPQGIAVRLGRALRVRRAVADDALDHDQGGAVVGRLEALKRPGQRLAVVGVVDLVGRPAIGAEALGHVLVEGELGVALDGHRIVVVDPAEVGELQVAGHGSRLAGHALHQVAVAAQGVDIEVEEVGVRPIVARRQRALRHGHADTVSRSLAERSGGDLHPGGVAIFRVARAAAAEFAESLDVLQADGGLLLDRPVLAEAPHASKMEQGVEQHARMPGRKDEAIAIGPRGLVRVVDEKAIPECVAHRRHGHRGAGVARLGLLHRVDCQGPDGVDRQLIEIARRGCRRTSLRHGGLAMRHDRSHTPAFRVGGRKRCNTLPLPRRQSAPRSAASIDVATGRNEQGSTLWDQYRDPAARPGVDASAPRPSSARRVRRRREAR